MPRIRWTHLPPALRDHLFDRPRERRITAEDPWQLELWRDSEPDAPDGSRFKEFGSFKVCGEGEFPRIFLLRGQVAKGKSLGTTAARSESRPQQGCERGTTHRYCRFPAACTSRVARKPGNGLPKLRLAWAPTRNPPRSAPRPGSTALTWARAPRSRGRP
jgi:hypothetical protein